MMEVSRLFLSPKR